MPTKAQSLGQGFRCRSGSKVLDFGDTFPVALLVEMLSPNVSKLVLRVRVKFGDRAVLDQPLDEKVFKRGVFCPKEVCAIYSSLMRRFVVDEERSTVESILES